MLTLACFIAAMAALGICCLAAYWVGRARRLRGSDGYFLGRAAGIRVGRDESHRERDQLREELNEAKDTLDATMLRFEEYVEDHANTYPPTIWSDAVPPGGQVCAVPVSDKPGEICGMPVESEPCPEHVCACFRTVDAAYAGSPLPALLPGGVR